MKSPFTRDSVRLYQWAWLAGLFWCGVLPSATSAPPPKVFASVVLSIEMSFGGYYQAFLLADGEIVTRESYQDKEKGPQERRYKTQLDAADLQKMRDVITKHHFFNLMKSGGSAWADEWVYEIDVKPPQGKAVSKWRPIRRMDPDFSAIAQQIQALGDKAKKTPPFYDGPKEENWKPAGFE